MSGWTATATCRARRNWLRRFSLLSSWPSEARAGTHNHRYWNSEKLERQLAQPRTPVVMGPGSALVALAWPGRRWRFPSLRPEHELAVAFEEGTGAHVELTVLTDEEQCALGHLLGALQQ